MLEEIYFNESLGEYYLLLFFLGFIERYILDDDHGHIFPQFQIFWDNLLCTFIFIFFHIWFYNVWMWIDYFFWKNLFSSSLFVSGLNYRGYKENTNGGWVKEFQNFWKNLLYTLIFNFSRIHSLILM